MLAHVAGFPVEETFLQLAPAGAATVTVVAFASRSAVGRLLSRLRRFRWRR
jgi:hypothetical protein